MDKKAPRKKRKITKTEMMFIWRRHIKPTFKNITYEEFEKICEIALKDFDDTYLNSEPAIVADYKYSKIIVAAIEYYKFKIMRERVDYNMTKEEYEQVKEYFEEDEIDTISEKIEKETEKILSSETEKNETDEIKLVKFGRRLDEESIYTTVIANYCLLSEEAQTKYRDVVLNKYKNHILKSNVKYEGLDETDFVDLASILTDEELEVINKSIEETLKAGNVAKTPSVVMYEEETPEEPTKKVDASLTEEDKKELWSMVKIGAVSIGLIALIASLRGCKLVKTDGTRTISPSVTPTDEATPIPTASVTPTPTVAATPTSTPVIPDNVSFEDVKDREGKPSADELYIVEIDGQLVPILGKDNYEKFLREQQGECDESYEEPGYELPNGTYIVYDPINNETIVYESRTSFMEFNPKEDEWILGPDKIYRRNAKGKVKSK